MMVNLNARKWLNCKFRFDVVDIKVIDNHTYTYIRTQALTLPHGGMQTPHEYGKCVCMCRC